MRVTIFGPESEIEDISMSNQMYPDNEKVAETDLFDSNNLRTKDTEPD